MVSFILSNFSFITCHLPLFDPNAIMHLSAGRRTNELKSDIDIPNDVIMKFKEFGLASRKVH